LKRLTADALVYYQFTTFELTHGVFTRCGGTSSGPFAALNLGGNVGDEPTAVRQNHELVYSTLGVRADHVCTVWQVHSADIVIANGPVRGRRWLAMADALITDRGDTPLSMRFADCTPLLFHDPAKGVIGMAHAGWRGTVAGIGARTVKAMEQAYGCRPADIRAGIGPSIGPNRYQVGEEVVKAVQDYFHAIHGLIRRDPSDNSAYLDLWAANQLDLQRAGVEQIEIAGICTAEHTDEFFSHRAEKGLTGRFGAVMTL
jgi:polyphenol oxidase